jgi:hypothetical protein
LSLDASAADLAANLGVAASTRLSGMRRLEDSRMRFERACANECVAMAWSRVQCVAMGGDAAA